MRPTSAYMSASSNPSLCATHYRATLHEKRGARGQWRRRNQVQEGAVTLSHLWQGRSRAKLCAKSLRFVKAHLFYSSSVSLHRCSPAGATWTSTCWLTAIRSTPARSVPANSFAWTSCEITFTFTSRWGSLGRLYYMYKQQVTLFNHCFLVKVWIFVSPFCKIFFSLCKNKHI